MFLIYRLRVGGREGGREGGRQAERYRVDKAGGCAVDKAGE
jgi:hypothetical protein